MKLEFLIPKIPFAVRIILFFALELCGIYYQVYFTSDIFSMEFLLSLLILLAGSFFMIARNYKNKPADLGFEDWRPVSRKEFDRIWQNLEKTKTTRFPLFYKKGLGIGIMICLSIVAFFLFIMEEFFPIIFIIDAVIILYPFLFTGVVNLWTPANMNLKMKRFLAVLAKIQPTEKKIIVTPYLRLDKDKEGRQIPEDVRFLLEPRRKAEDFVGVQLQVAINNGPNGAVPYMYAVFLCKGKGSSFEKIKRINFAGFKKEPGGDDEYGYIVVRQPTGGGGYHTSDDECIRLLERVKTAFIEL